MENAENSQNSQPRRTRRARAQRRNTQMDTNQSEENNTTIAQRMKQRKSYKKENENIYEENTIAQRVKEQRALKRKEIQNQPKRKKEKKTRRRKIKPKPLDKELGSKSKRQKQQKNEETNSDEEDELDFSKEEEKADNCIICFDELSQEKPNEQVTLECEHTFHLKCIQNVIGKFCPLCRALMPYGKEPVQPPPEQIFITQPLLRSPIPLIEENSSLEYLNPVRIIANQFHFLDVINHLIEEHGINPNHISVSQFGRSYRLGGNNQNS